MKNRQQVLLEDFNNLNEQAGEIEEAVIVLSANQTAVDYLMTAYENTVQSRAEIMFQLREYGFTDFDSIMEGIMKNGTGKFRTGTGARGKTQSAGDTHNEISPCCK